MQKNENRGPTYFYDPSSVPFDPYADFPPPPAVGRGAPRNLPPNFSPGPRGGGGGSWGRGGRGGRGGGRGGHAGKQGGNSKLWSKATKQVVHFMPLKDILVAAAGVVDSHT